MQNLDLKMHTGSQSHWRIWSPCPQYWLLVLNHRHHLQCLNSWHLYTAAQHGGKDCSTGKVVAAVFGGLGVLRINGFFSTMLCSKINLVSACHELTQIVALWLFKAQHLSSAIRLPLLFHYKIKQSDPLLISLKAVSWDAC